MLGVQPRGRYHPDHPEDEKFTGREAELMQSDDDDIFEPNDVASDSD